MKILFIGGTGRLSKDVAKKTVDSGHEVFLITRGTSARAMFADSRYHMLYGDARNEEMVRTLISDYSFDVVIDFLSYNPKQLEGIMNAVENKCNQFIFISSAAVYKRVKGELISEEKTEIGNDRWKYAYDKYLCEKELVKHFENTAVNYTIVRPAVTYGNTRIPYPIVPQNTQKEYSFLSRVLTGAPIPFFDDGRIDVTLTHTRDFAKGVVGLMGNSKAYGEAFHITSNEKLQMGDILSYLEQIMDLSVNRLSVTQEEIYKAIPYYKEILVGDKGESARYDNSKILQAVLGLSFDIGLKEGLTETVKFYQENKALQLIDYQWMGKIDRLAVHKRSAIIPLQFHNTKEKMEYLCGRYKGLEPVGKAVRAIGRCFSK